MTDFQAKLFYLAMKPRPPYVRVAQAVSWIGEPGSGRGFVGARLVEAVSDKFVRNCYRVLLAFDPTADPIYNDNELSCLHEEVDPGFWRLPISQGFRNVHEFVRWDRRRREASRSSYVLHQYLGRGGKPRY